MRLVQVHFYNFGNFFAAWVTFSHSKVAKNFKFEIIFEFGPYLLNTQKLRLRNLFYLEIAHVQVTNIDQKAKSLR
jgi:hypothetical protein